MALWEWTGFFLSYWKTICLFFLLLTSLVFLYSILFFFPYSLKSLLELTWEKWLALNKMCREFIACYMFLIYKFQNIEHAYYLDRVNEFNIFYVFLWISYLLFVKVMLKQLVKWLLFFHSLNLICSLVIYTIFNAEYLRRFEPYYGSSSIGC